MRLKKRSGTKTQHMFDHACDAKIVEKESDLITVEITDGYSDAEFFLSMASGEAKALAQSLLKECEKKDALVQLNREKLKGVSGA